MALLKRQHPALEAPPPGVREGSVLWSEYVTYRTRRLAELEEGRAAKGPLRWQGYREMRGLFSRGLDFERAMVDLLRADAALNPEGGPVQVQVQRVRLVYEGGHLKPGQPAVWNETVNEVQGKVQGVEVLLQ